MKNLKHILIVFLSLMVFITSSGLTVNLHYCAGKLANVSLKDNHANCMMSKASSSNCSNKVNSSVSEKNTCCKNQFVKVKSEIKITDNKAKDDAPTLNFLIFVKNYLVSFFTFDNVNEDDNDETSVSFFPLLKEGLYILLQNFRN